jgi:hypothetical protein
MAEREGFEPSVALLRLHSLSRRAPSANSAISPRCARHRGNLFFGGGSRIRTHGTSRYSGFQDRRLKPLGHPSIKSLHDFTQPSFAASSEPLRPKVGVSPTSSVGQGYGGLFSRPQPKRRLSSLPPPSPIFRAPGTGTGETHH